MTPPAQGTRRRWRPGPIAYAAAWLVGGAAVSIVIIALLGGSEDGPTNEPAVAPIAPADLDSAALRAACEVRRHTDSRPAEPPSGGPSGFPPPPAVYRAPLDRSAVVAALRRGRVVLQYRPGLSPDALEQLEGLHKTVPAGTIVTPNPRMTAQVAITAWRRALLCPHFKPETLDAIRLFRGRFLGKRPRA